MSKYFFLDALNSTLILPFKKNIYIKSFPRTTQPHQENTWVFVFFCCCCCFLIVIVFPPASEFSSSSFFFLLFLILLLLLFSYIALHSSKKIFTNRFFSLFILYFQHANLGQRGKGNKKKLRNG